MNNEEYGHYTSQNGMMNVITFQQLWATNIKYLNDEHEFQHALDLINEILPKSNYSKDSQDYNKYLEYIKAIKEKTQNLDAYQAESVFTISFTEETDLLSQWRGYCPNNNGFCIKFDVRNVHSEVTKIYDEVYLLDCVYDQEQKEGDLKKLLNKYWSSFIAGKTNKEESNVIDELAKEILLLASYFKHPSFSEEKEKRIVIVLDYAADNDLKFREGQFSIIPYLELPISKDYIKSIVIGPTSNKKQSKRSLELFLENTYDMASFIGGPTVEVSSTPYRSW